MSSLTDSGSGARMRTVGELVRRSELGLAREGIDHCFVTPVPANKLVVNHGDDQDHFDSNYFGKGIKWNLPDLQESERGYTRACEVFDAHGRSVLDATVGGKLRLFEKIAIGDVIRICRA